MTTSLLAIPGAYVPSGLFRWIKPHLFTELGHSYNVQCREVQTQVPHKHLFPPFLLPLLSAQETILVPSKACTLQHPCWNAACSSWTSIPFFPIMKLFPQWDKKIRDNPLHEKVPFLLDWGRSLQICWFTSQNTALGIFLSNLFPWEKFTATKLIRHESKQTWKC